MLQLPNVTLICVSTNDYDGGVSALIRSRTDIQWGAVKLITANSPWRAIEDTLMWGIKIIDIEPFETIDNWNHFIFYRLHEYIDTEYCMLIHPDGYVTNADKWDSRFLDYDYIGAPWPAGIHHDTRGNEVRVGNSVGIRSKRLLELPSVLGLQWQAFDDHTNEDTAVCVHYRHHFLNAGMTFAPVDVAALFAHEIPIPETEGITPFAFHQYEPPFAPFSMSDVYASYVNLDSRPDRNEHMQQELQKVGIQAVRTRGLLPEEVDQPQDKLAVMWNRTKGAVGCHYSQVAVMEEALRKNQHAMVMEDDLVFCDDIQDRLTIIEQFLSERDWDIMWLGGTYHKDPTWHKSINGVHTHPDLQMCYCDLNKDWEPTDNPHIVRTYGCWSTYAYIVNRKRLGHILDLLDQNVYRSMGIDWLMILMQPNLQTFAFNPGCVKQYDNQSNIGNGITKFSVFETLGDHWFKNKL